MILKFKNLNFLYILFLTEINGSRIKPISKDCWQPVMIEELIKKKTKINNYRLTFYVG